MHNNPMASVHAKLACTTTNRDDVHANLACTKAIGMLCMPIWHAHHETQTNTLPTNPMNVIKGYNNQHVFHIKYYSPYNGVHHEIYVGIYTIGCETLPYPIVYIVTYTLHFTPLQGDYFLVIFHELVAHKITWIHADPTNFLVMPCLSLTPFNSYPLDIAISSKGHSSSFLDFDNKNELVDAIN
jgi:hypothetical protein